METRDGVPLSAILSAISPQLLALGTKVAKLEEVIGQTVQCDASLSNDLIFEIQDLDRVRQSILDLARLTRHLSEEAINGILTAGQIEAIGKTLHLNSTKQLLSGTLQEEPKPEPDELASDLQLF